MRERKKKRTNTNANREDEFVCPAGARTNLLSLRVPPLLLSAELLHFLVAPALLPLVLLPQLAFSLLLLRAGEKPQVRSKVMPFTGNRHLCGDPRSCRAATLEYTKG